MFTVLAHAIYSVATTFVHSNVNPIQPFTPHLAPLFSLPASPMLFNVIASKPQLGQDRVGLQRLRDRLGTVVADVVAPEP
jgi:hypothetical protein